MIFRTDLALEAEEQLAPDIRGEAKLERVVRRYQDCTLTRIRIGDENTAGKIGKPKGTYSTLEFPAISDHLDGEDRYLLFTAEELSKYLPEEGLVLVAGLGNRDITPDALGPKTTETVLATRHVNRELGRIMGVSGIRPVAVTAPGVLGDTGVEAAEMLLSLVEHLKPSALIVVDALAAKSLDRLGRTVQITSAGIAPGGGVGNERPEISRRTMGIPVIGIGVPTVVDASTLAADLLGTEREEDQNVVGKMPMMVTPREIDLLISRAARLISMAVNKALHADLTIEDMTALVQ